MKLNELNLDGYKHIKNNDWDYSRQLIDWLKSKNFKLLGEGSYSSVFQSPTENFVVKVNKGYIDQGFLKFVDFCHKNKGNLHLPKIGEIKKFDKFYIVFIEKLESNNGEHDNDDIALDIEKLVLMSDSYEKVMKDIKSFYSEDIVKQIIECADILKDFLKNKKLFVDLHGENIMWRGNILVITDPVI